MHLGHLLSSTSTLQISSPGVPSSHQFLLDSRRPEQVRAIIAPMRGMENNGEVQTAQPPRSCSSPEAPGKSCWSLDLRVAVLLVTLAAAVILLLLYKLLQLRHRLRLARAMNALEYSSFYHSATYRLKHPTACQETPIINGVIPEDTTPIQTIAAAVSSTVIGPPAPPPPALPLPPTPVLPPPPEHRPSTPRVLSLPLPLPLIQTTPPSPHLSWGACSDAEVYSRIGAFRPSRLSSLSSQSTVILFEHSAL
ncbi:uncharacterized protein LOC119780586 [Cyprinodon tularosa]|uniref:uncharacterized protein LOC119780586 n=1 Tax=Cyprinodon tularosa TaxID=77115 RepID=UPI0018E1FDE9|nr:uncharacterized protein LOC119780586 [Cyprinodon tularosa]XP_038136596.1 uncharacterized protein LOC119780586 [Cyprinodon tularosa]